MSASQRPEVAGEPEAGADGTAGRVGLREQIDAAIRGPLLIGLQDAELDGPAGKQRIGEWADWIAETVMAVRDRRMEQLAAGRETWKAKAAEIEADRDRLAERLDLAHAAIAAGGEMYRAERDRAACAVARVQARPDETRVGLRSSPYVATLPDLTHDCTGWGWSCPSCPHGEDGCLTRWGARRRQRRHLRTAHR